MRVRFQVQDVLMTPVTNGTIYLLPTLRIPRSLQGSVADRIDPWFQPHVHGHDYDNDGEEEGRNN